MSHGDSRRTTSVSKPISGRRTDEGSAESRGRRSEDGFAPSPAADALPAVLLNTPVRGHSHAALCIDNRGCARVMLRHLARVGHQRIAFISGPDNNFDIRISSFAPSSATGL